MLPVHILHKGLEARASNCLSVSDAGPKRSLCTRLDVYGNIERSVQRVRNLKVTLAMMAITAILVLAFTEAAAMAMPKDIASSWAKDAIESLINSGVITGYPDGTFRPNSNITRAEFAKIVATAFGYRPTRDIELKDVNKNHWARPYIQALVENGIMQGYEDGTFRPKNPVTRAEVVAMLARTLNIDLSAFDPDEWAPSFRDVDDRHWAYKFVEIAQSLGIVPLHYGLVFEPSKEATRADVAAMVKTLVDLHTVQGTVAGVNSTTGTITVRGSDGETEQVQIGFDTRILRNGVPTDITNVRKGDKVNVITSSYGTPAFVVASGVVTKEDVTGKISHLTGGILSPEQVEAIARGDWEAARAGLYPALKNRLIGYGLSDAEADALLSRDWNTLKAAGKERLAQAIADELGISAELAEAVLSQDWENAKVYAQIDVAQMVVSKLLNM